MCSERKARAAHIALPSMHIPPHMMRVMFTVSAVRVDGAPQLRPSSPATPRSGSAAGRCSLLRRPNEQRRAERPCAWSPQSASDVDVAIELRATPSVCVTASTCRRRADGLRNCRESEPAQIERQAMLIRDGECNTLQSRKVIFVQLQMGGRAMGEWLST
jgi:hypothetical protein